MTQVAQYEEQKSFNRSNTNIIRHSPMKPLFERKESTINMQGMGKVMSAIER